jgi:hypothetical protein
VFPELEAITWSASNGSFSFFPSPQMWQRIADSRTALARRWYSPPYCPVWAFRIALLASCICFACSACGSHSGSGDSTPQIRQGLGNLLIFSPTFPLEVYRWRVKVSLHYLSAVSADRFVFFRFDASGNGDGHRTTRAGVLVGRHSLFSILSSSLGVD